MTRIMVVTGSGGVGKTTMAGAIGALAAARGTATLVLTVDPARRLAQTLGLEHIGGEPVEVAPDLDAAMLDAAASWEALVRRHADEATADRLVASRFFRAIADRFPSGQAYAAAEETLTIASSGHYGLLVVDTPPVGGGVDFFDAPGAIRSLVAGKALRILTGPPIPGRRLLYGLTARPALKLADKVLGGPLLEDLGSFLVDLRVTYDGIRRRAAEVERMLASSRSIVVSTPDPGPADEARRLLERHSQADPVVVLNRVVPSSWVGHGDLDGDAHDRVLAWWALEALRHASVAESLVATGAEVLPVRRSAEPPVALDDLLALARSSGFEQILSD